MLAALVDNHTYFGNQLGFDIRRPMWRRVLDMNDRIVGYTRDNKAIRAEALKAQGAMTEERFTPADASRCSCAQ